MKDIKVIRVDLAKNVFRLYLSQYTIQLNTLTQYIK
ncbi:Uncharacterised protein [Legionella pneumophila subsp. pascullei]|uniref:Uncharacterized protein n=1 Tax=Legionella pneumophila subsp. pascullei TaxID=91890 RepID=A0AAX2J023_LEGPN|nr:Uncharacterised protein [Legionella pneumophila subsp. pascullei]VEH07358.1 Uncharacterised protein [Legionella pneumophila subsp. pascullei]